MIKISFQNDNNDSSLFLNAYRALLTWCCKSVKHAPVPTFFEGTAGIKVKKSKLEKHSNFSVFTFNIKINIFNQVEGLNDQ